MKDHQGGNLMSFLCPAWKYMIASIIFYRHEMDLDIEQHIKYKLSRKHDGRKTLTAAFKRLFIIIYRQECKEAVSQMCANN